MPTSLSALRHHDARRRHSVVRLVETFKQATCNRFEELSPAHQYYSPRVCWDQGTGGFIIRGRYAPAGARTHPHVHIRLIATPNFRCWPLVGSSRSPRHACRSIIMWAWGAWSCEGVGEKRLSQRHKGHASYGVSREGQEGGGIKVPCGQYDGDLQSAGHRCMKAMIVARGGQRVGVGQVGKAIKGETVRGSADVSWL
jgi:hypothetical protein